MDDYVWLDGKPIARVRSTLDSTYKTRTDTGTFTRQWPEQQESVGCDTYISFFDHIGRPFYTVRRSDGSTVWHGDWDPFGKVNKVQVWDETAHPYSNNASVGLGAFNEPGASWFRVHFTGFDTDAGDKVTIANKSTGVTLNDLNSNPAVYSGALKDNWTPRIAMPSPGFTVSFTSDASGTGDGVVEAEYEYGFYSIGTEVQPRTRFPGQYFDGESDLHDNWHRSYDPGSGRYVQSDPLLQAARAVLQWSAVHSYGYAHGNPLAFLDRRGLRCKLSVTEFGGQVIPTDLPGQWSGLQPCEMIDSTGQSYECLCEYWQDPFFQLTYMKYCWTDDGTCPSCKKHGCSTEPSAYRLIYLPTGQFTYDSCEEIPGPHT